MPIKVRCEGCQTVLNVSDQAAGKAVKCKQCGGRVSVPAAGAAAPAKKRPKQAEAPDDFLSGLDLNRAEDTKRKVCPGCARPVRDEDIDCPKCGVTIATGSLSDKQRRKIERKGPPPEEFYKEVWGNSWKFLKKHWHFAVQTALVWTVCVSMSLTSLFSLNYYITNRVAGLYESQKAAGENVKIQGNYVLITVPKDGGAGNVVYDGTYYTEKGSVTRLWKPEIQARKEPPSMFWMAMTLVFQLGFGGWAWTMATLIAGVTMAGEKKVKRFTLDFFGNITLGFRFYVWPTVLLLPLMIIPGIIIPFNLQVGAIIAGSLLIIPLLVLPAAVVHMAQKYSYRSWLMTWMVKDFFRTLAPSLYIFAMNLFLVLLVPIGLAVAGAVMQGKLVNLLMNQQAIVLNWLKANVVDFGEGNLRFLFYQMPMVFTACFVFFFIVFAIMSAPTIFMMRVIGLYGLYFRTDLSVVNEFPDMEPAGFGPRYLAFLVDTIILVLLAGVGLFVGTLVGGLVGFLYQVSFANLLQYGFGGVATLALWGFYFASGEAGSARATLGKWSLGIVVLRDDSKPQTRQEALQRAMCSFLSVLTVYIGFLMCLFRPDKKAMQDLMSKTKVVWQGEQT